MLRLKWITDIHNCHADPRLNALPPRDAPARRAQIHQILDNFAEQSRKEKPTLVVNTGDNIDTSLDVKHDFILLTEVQERLKAINGVAMTLAGNHDVARIAQYDLSKSFGILAKSQLLHDPSASIILWSADPTPIMYTGRKHYRATNADIEQLERHLSNTKADKPVLLFSHIPVFSDAHTRPTDGTEIKNPDKGGYINSQTIMDTIAASGRKVVAFAGHRHINRVLQVTPKLTVVTMDRLYRDSPGQDRPAGTNIATIELKKNRLRIKREGAAPRDFGFTL